MSRLVLLDANHLMHRAYWAIQRTLSTSDGEQVNTVFGVASMLLSIFKQEKPALVIACFDEGGETFRHEQHEEYKAGRAETPDDFYDQIPRVYECFSAFSIPTLSNPTYEADDLMGTLSVLGKQAGYEVLLVSGDRDLFQLVQPNVQVVIPHKGYAQPEHLDASGVQEKLGVTPEQIADYKGLTGDSSDNLKGVQGIGPKTTTTLLQQYPTLEDVYAHLDAIRPSVRQKLEADKESAFFCRQMAQIVTDIPLDIDLAALEQQHPSRDAIDGFFEQLEFHMLRRRFRTMLKDDQYAQEYFSGEMPDLFEEEERDDGSQMTVEQLPLLD